MATALDMTQDDVSATEDPKAGPSSIIEGILFSRRFILSYQLVLIGLLILFTVRHWTHQLRRLEKRELVDNRSRSADDHLQAGENQRMEYSDIPKFDKSRVSSSSSTLIGTPPLPKATPSEQTPLITPARRPKKNWQLAYSARSFLLYQPSPIPLINKVLPSNGITLTILAFIGLQIFYTLYKMPFSIPTIFVFADRTSLLFVANLPWLYLFSAKNQPIKHLTGYSYETLNIFHRRLGEIMCLLALLHTIGMVATWYTLLLPTGFGFTRFISSKIILLGIGAFVSYELIYFTSLRSFRQRWYELFLALHVSLQVAALALVWFHHSNSRWYVGAALVIFLVDRFVYRMVLKVYSSRAWLEACDDGSTVVLSTPVMLAQRRRFLTYLAGAGVTSGWKATDHVFLTVPALSRKHVIQAHPFTITSQAPHQSDSEAELKLIIRAQNGFSRDLVNYAKSLASVKIRIDGPYGSRNALNLLQHCDLSVIVAGGSGIAVGLPLVWELLSSGGSFDLENAPASEWFPRIVLIWVTRHKSHAKWLDPMDIQKLQEHWIEVIMPPPTAESGHPDISGIIKSWISGHDDTFFDGNADIGVVCSGPDGMARVVRNTCSSLVAGGRNVSVEVEKFGW
ncbi:MAG: hypothetical protein Q9219_003010 [cf. Caloplaca sp. 3 TL-2023]